MAVTVEDPTARTRIRDAALVHFGEDGYERTTVRAIAVTAGISHGMLRHHFGSKIALRAACDNYIVAVLHRLNTDAPDAPTSPAWSEQSARRFWRYVARTLADGSPTAGPIFDEMVTMTERWLVGADGARPGAPTFEPGGVGHGHGGGHPVVPRARSPHWWRRHLRPGGTAPDAIGAPRPPRRSPTRRQRKIDRGTPRSAP